MTDGVLRELERRWRESGSEEEWRRWALAASRERSETRGAELLRALAIFEAATRRHRAVDRAYGSLPQSAARKLEIYRRLGEAAARQGRRVRRLAGALRDLELEPPASTELAGRLLDAVLSQQREPRLRKAGAVDFTLPAAGPPRTFTFRITGASQLARRRELFGERAEACLEVLQRWRDGEVGDEEARRHDREASGTTLLSLRRTCEGVGVFARASAPGPSVASAEAGARAIADLVDEEVIRAAPPIVRWEDRRRRAEAKEGDLSALAREVGGARANSDWVDRSGMRQSYLCPICGLSVHRSQLGFHYRRHGWRRCSHRACPNPTPGSAGAPCFAHEAARTRGAARP